MEQDELVVPIRRLKMNPDYWVTSDGRVWSDTTNRFLSHKTINNYDKVTLPVIVKKIKTYTIHRLVAENFIEKPVNFDVTYLVNHKDCNKKNNRVDNLEWVTSLQNFEHAVLNNRVKKYRINQYTLDGTLVKTHYGVRLAGRNIGKEHSSILKALDNKHRTAYGFIWKKVS